MHIPESIRRKSMNEKERGNAHDAPLRITDGKTVRKEFESVPSKGNRLNYRLED